MTRDEIEAYHGHPFLLDLRFSPIATPRPVDGHVRPGGRTLCRAA